jgi:chitinase
MHLFTGGLLTNPTFFRIALAITLSFPLVVRTGSGSDLENGPKLAGKRLVADYDSGSKFLAPPYTYSAAQIPYSKITHIIHAGVGFDADGNLQVPDQFIEPELIPHAHAAGTRVVLLIGGDVTGLEANPSAVPVLVKNLKEFVTTSTITTDSTSTGSIPQAADDTAFLLTLEKAFRSDFPTPRYTLSIDAAPWSADLYDAKHLKNVIDWFNIMTYDCAGPWTAHGQLNSPIFWDPADPAPYECEPGGSDQQSAEPSSSPTCLRLSSTRALRFTAINTPT